MQWFERHSTALQGMGALVTAVAAVAALIGIKIQIDASAQQQQEQSARDIYREFLNLSVNKPEFAEPDYCSISNGPNAAAYEDYVSYLLYTTEQMLNTSAEWETTMDEHLIRHRDYICTQQNWSAEAPEVQSLIARFQANHCVATTRDCG